MQSVILVVSLWALVLPVSTLGQTPDVPKDWKEVKACKFTFELPTWMREKEVKAVDSCLASFGGRDIYVNLDYGWYSAPLSKTSEWMKDYTTKQISIGGREATLIGYTDSSHDRYSVTQVHIITTPLTADNPQIVSLLFTIKTKPNENPSTIARIYESIRFSGN